MKYHICTYVLDVQIRCLYL